MSMTAREVKAPGVMAARGGGYGRFLDYTIAKYRSFADALGPPPSARGFVEIGAPRRRSHPQAAARARRGALTARSHVAKVTCGDDSGLVPTLGPDCRGELVF
jgi:hypothetical protein